MIMGISLLLAVCWVAFACFCAMVVMDRGHKSLQPLARVQGRTLAYCLAGVALVTVVASLALYVSPWIIAVPSLGLGLYIMYEHIVFLPFSQQLTNQVFVSAAALLAWASICLMASLLLLPAYRSGAGLSFLMASPFVAFAGWTLADRRWIGFDDVVELSSPAVVAVKVRRVLQQADIELQDANVRSVTVHGLGTASSSRHQAKGAFPGRGAASKNSGPRSPYDQSDKAREAEELLAEAVEFFQGDPMVHIIAADFLADIRQNRHLEQTHLSAASALSPKLDLQCIIFCRQ